MTIDWPDFSNRTPRNIEPVTSPLDVRVIYAPPTVTALNEKIARDRAPRITVSATRTSPPRKKSAAGIVFALCISVLTHAAIAAYLAERLRVESLQTATDAVKVALVFAAPRPRKPAADAASKKSLPSAFESMAINWQNSFSDKQIRKLPESIQSTPQRPEPVTHTPEDGADKSIQMRSAGMASSPAPLVENASADRPVPSDKPTKPDLTEPQSTAASPVAVPAAQVPLPTPRPVREAAKTAPAKASTKAQSRHSEKPQPRRKFADKAPRGKSANANTRKRSAATVSRKKSSAAIGTEKPRKVARTTTTGRASNAAQTAYSRRLLGHVQRHKRYPASARKQGLGGSASLAISIDRNGRLQNATLRRRSGHATLDREALATARRAAPYPRPPEGVGGRSIRFSVTLRFKQ